MPHIYNIGYRTHEESEDAQFFFNRKLTKKEFRDYVHKATANALKYAINHKDEFPWDSRGEGISFEYLYPRVIKELKKFGFKSVEYDGEWDCFGWSSVCTNNWKGHAGLETKLLLKSIPKGFKQKALKISRKEKEKLYKRIEKSRK